MSAGHRVVVSHEAQHSIRAADREPPSGWAGAGFAATREECPAHIETVWTGMRPSSLRDRKAISI